MTPATTSPKRDAPEGKSITIEQRLVLNSPNAVVFISPTWQVEYANRKALELAQKGWSEVTGADFRTSFPEFAGAQIQLVLMTALADQTETEVELEMGGRWWQVWVSPHPEGTALYFRDLTNLQVAQQIVREQEAELSDFFENAHVALHWVGPDGRILWANEAELSMLGYTAGEYIGRNIKDFHVDLPVIEDILCRLSGNEKLHDHESRLRRKDGSIVDVSINSSVYFKDEEFVHTRCFTRDVTAEKAKAEIQDRLVAIVQSSDDAIISKDLNGIIKSWNKSAERLFGYTAEEAIGQSVATLLIPNERQDEEPEILSKLRRGQRVDHFETKRKRKDGTLLDISLTISPVKDATGKVTGASKIARDITEHVRNVKELRDANEALKRSNRDLELFAYSASHDLQEPLRMVSAYSEMLRREFGSKLGESGDEYIGYAIQGALRMEQLLKDLRAYTLVTTAGADSAVEIGADEALDKALSNLGAAIKENSASISRTQLPRVCIAPVELEQVFQNLIANAIRYRRSDVPQVDIACESRGNDFLFSVKDNGIGIDLQYKEQIFELFKRLHTSAEYPGSGLGLAICQRIVERAGGRIWVESELGQGSTFFFTLPVRIS
jgi:PAS domain S-box-containing protein